jgi:hypothetical protein
MQYTGNIWATLREHADSGQYTYSEVELIQEVDDDLGERQHQGEMGKVLQAQPTDVSEIPSKVVTKKKVSAYKTIIVRDPSGRNSHMQEAEN